MTVLLLSIWVIGNVVNVYPIALVNPVLWDSCENLSPPNASWQAGGASDGSTTISIDMVDKVEGTGSIHVNSGNTFALWIRKFTHTYGWNWESTPIIRYRIKVSTVNPALKPMSFVLRTTDGAGNYWYWNYQSFMPTQANAWETIELDLRTANEGVPTYLNKVVLIQWWWNEGSSTPLTNVDFLLDFIEVGSSGTPPPTPTPTPMPTPLTVNLTPDNLSVATGQSATFQAVAAGGTPPYTYKFFVNGTSASDPGSQTTFTIPSTLEGIYNIKVVVTSTAGGSSSASDTSLLIVNNPAERKLIINQGAGGTTNPAAGTYTHAIGTSVTITASPLQSYVFQCYIVDGAPYPNSTLTLTMNVDHVVDPVFSKTEPSPTIKVLERMFALNLFNGLMWIGIGATCSVVIERKWVEKHK